jgi:hypothetical protein
LSDDNSQWKRTSSPHFFLPVEVLSRVFRGKFKDALKEAFAQRQINFYGHLSHLADKKQFARFIQTLYHHKWVVYAKPPFGAPEHVLNYLARYTHRIAISNHRLLSFDGQHVTFRWKDYAHGNKKRKMTVTADEFLSRFLLHVLPPGFVRIRHYGFLANRRRTAAIALCRKLIGEATQSVDEPVKSSGSKSNWACPKCSGLMMVGERLSTSQVLHALSDERCVLDSS